jgi:hypothetical protein
MGHAAAEAIVRAGLPLVPYTLTGYSAGVAVGGVGVAGIPVEVVGRETRQEALDRVKRLYGGWGGGEEEEGGGGKTAAGPNNNNNNNTTANPPSNLNGRLIVVDYTTPAAALDNARFYARNGVPFVMGTTGADAAEVASVAEEAGVFALVAPQMGKQVVALQAALQMAADAFPGAFAGYELDAVESHQASKVDVSGTAREVVRSLRALGGRFAAEEEDGGEEETEGEEGEEGGKGQGSGGRTTSSTSSSDPAWHVRRVRDRATQQSPALGVPYDALGGHAYHTYTLSSPGAPPLPPLLSAAGSGGGGGGKKDQQQQQQQQPKQQKEDDSDPDAGSWSRFVFKHNVVGREIYANGTADAALFLAAMARQQGASAGAATSGSASAWPPRRVFDMVDVLRAGDLRQRAARAAAARARGGGGGGDAAGGGGRGASSPSVAAAAAASAAATRSAKEQRAKAAMAAGESDGAR